MVKYTVAASVALLQLAMFSQTSVALPIEQSPEGLESRAVSNLNDQQLAERHDMELEERSTVATVLAGGAALVAGAIAVHFAKKAYKSHQEDQAKKQNGQTGGTPPVDNPQKAMDPPAGGPERRDLSELDARDWEDIAKRYFDYDLLDRRDATSYDGSQLHSKSRRDLSDLNERDSDEYEKRSFDEFEERDWDDYEMEARGLDFDELDELD